jgi:hypothetical protein
MKARESGMPDATLWETFFDPPRILALPFISLPPYHYGLVGQKPI